MDPIDSPSQLWLTLQTQAGLELRRKKGEPGRDADVEVALQQALDLPTGGQSLAEQLKADQASGAPTINTETFLLKLLKSQEGFALMMYELLEMLEDAKAKRDSETLAIQFRFDRVSDPLRFTLEAFAQTVMRVRNVLALRVKLPPSGALFDLLGNLCHASDFTPETYDEREFPPLKPLSATRHGTLEQAQEIVSEVVEAFRSLCLSFGENRDAAYASALAQRNDALKNAQEVVYQVEAGLNHWDLAMRDVQRHIADQVNAGLLESDTVVSRIAYFLDGVERYKDWVSRLQEEVLELLNLPVWRKRHELYSVWAGSVLLRTAEAEADTFHYHVSGGALSFEFGGNRLATYEYDGEQFDIWAELRSDLVGQSKKRKKGIQPDFRVLRPALALNPNNATQLVLECKHYLTPSPSNFTEAVSDYARSCPNASVVLVNHGPADAAALNALVDPSMQARTLFLGDATVIQERATRALANAFRKALFPRSRLYTPRPAAELGGSITLKWGAELVDVDLHLQLDYLEGRHQVQVNYDTQGDLQASPFAQLKEDQRKGPGTERIDIARWEKAIYSISAKIFSGGGAFTPDNVHCVVHLPGSTHTLQCKAPIADNDWKIATIYWDQDGVYLRPWVETLEQIA
ncbi:hypothetical protein ACQKPE_11475 [Pseudomonas sp. NPDC089554]|uniref:hypothetical protein n=1 Tax=Pseudomonas sp. NPDC089554 TaxID=3390653 RepID=UPI003D063C04